MLHSAGIGAVGRRGEGVIHVHVLAQDRRLHARTLRPDIGGRAIGVVEPERRNEHQAPHEPRRDRRDFSRQRAADRHPDQIDRGLGARRFQQIERRRDPIELRSSTSWPSPPGKPGSDGATTRRVSASLSRNLGQRGKPTHTGEDIERLARRPFPKRGRAASFTSTKCSATSLIIRRPAPSATVPAPRAPASATASATSGLPICRRTGPSTAAPPFARTDANSRWSGPCPYCRTATAA